MWPLSGDRGVVIVRIVGGVIVRIGVRSSPSGCIYERKKNVCVRPLPRLPVCTGMCNLICGAHHFKVDRSPTGSGVTARIAVQYHKHQIKLGVCFVLHCVGWNGVNGILIAQKFITSLQG